MTVAEKIREARKARGLTQKELGKALGVTQATVQQYESGKRNPKRETIQRIADALGVSIECLLDKTVYTEKIEVSDNIIVTIEDPLNLDEKELIRFADALKGFTVFLDKLSPDFRVEFLKKILRFGDPDE